MGRALDRRVEQVLAHRALELKSHGLTGLPDAIGVVWPAATVQLCVVHLIRASLRYASKKDWGALTKDLRLIYTAVDETAADAALDAFAAT
jgi:putative transposase